MLVFLRKILLRINFSFLYIASENGHDKVVKLLLDNKVYPNPKNDWDSTPLHYGIQL
jgi:ankyrin repeat protein